LGGWDGSSRTSGFVFDIEGLFGKYEHLRAFCTGSFEPGFFRRFARNAYVPGMRVSACPFTCERELGKEEDAYGAEQGRGATHPL